ncbi:MAG: hypothetical protein IT289_11570 [Oligoflexia bacterium]|nr:hypothetical protein [Oligoflexia bacterium]
MGLKLLMVWSFFFMTHSLLASMGGMTGGGDLLPIEPMTTAEFSSIIKDSRKTLRLFLKDFCSGTPYQNVNLFCNAPAGNTKLWDIVESTDVEVLWDEPCYEADGKETFASIYASESNAICLSAHKIIPKLPQRYAKIQILGLMLHEFGHLAGATEAQAVELQKQAVFRLGAFLSKDQTLLKVLDVISKQTDYFEGVVKNISNLTENELLDRLTQEKVGLFYIEFPYYSDFIFSSEDSCVLGFYDSSFELAMAYLHSKIDNTVSPPPSYQSWSNYLEDKFIDGEINYSCGKQREFVIKRITNQDEVVTVIKQLASSRYEIQDYLRSLYFNHKVPQFSNPQDILRTDYWKPFTGTYKVVSRTCDTSQWVADDIGQLSRWEPYYLKRISEVTIQPSSERSDVSVLQFETLTGNNMTYDVYNHVDSRDYTSSIGGVDWAEAHMIYGDSWKRHGSQPWSRDYISEDGSIRVEKDLSNKLTLTIGSKYKNWYRDENAQFECKFVLE